MRVIAGAFKGRRLGSPTWSGVRPTSDRLRETLFDVLGDRVQAARVIDGFAGTGALGIEALSRGAAHVIFIDADRRAVALIADNLRRCGVERGYAIIRATIRQAWRRRTPGDPADLVLLDPPYDGIDLDEVLGFGAARLARNGLMVLEHGRRHPPRSDPSGLTPIRTIRSGQSVLAFYRCAEPLCDGR